MAEVDVDTLLALDPATVACPYGTYADLRTHRPVRWVEQLRAFMVTRHDDVEAVLAAPQDFSSAMASGPGSVTGLAHRLVDDPATPATLREQAQRRIELSKSAVLLNCDPPQHIRQRKLVNKAFTARRVLEMESAVLAIANTLADGFAAAGRVELVSQFSIRLPMTVIANILGVSADMHPAFKRWSDAFVAGVGSVNLTEERIADLFTAVDEFYDYFTEQIDWRRDHPGDDLVSAIIGARLDGETPLTLNEMLQMLVQLLVAGNETTTNLITSVVFTLVQDARLMARVRADNELIPHVAEEVLRLESPVQGTFRTAVRDTTIAGVAIPAGATLYLVLGSANRDESTYERATTLDPDRRSSHLAFGKGEHFCLGASIARLETRVAIDTLLGRLDDIELDCDPADIAYLPTFAHHGITRLPLRFREPGSGNDLP